MNKIISSAFILLLVISLYACTKRDGANQNLDPNKQEKSNYMSTKKGSWWLFGARNGDVVKRTASGIDSMKNGLKFSYFEKLDTNTKFITPEYFGKNGNLYVSLYDFDGAQTNYTTLVFLQDSVQQGSNWTNTQDYTYSGIKVNLLFESKVDFIDGTLSLGDSTYKEVSKVHTNVKWKPNALPTYIDAGRLDIWFAKGIGIIKEEVDIKITGIPSVQHSDSLLKYYIAP